MITLIPNDPAAAGSTHRFVVEAPDRAAGVARFAVDAQSHVPANPYDPASGAVPYDASRDAFLVWQCREAALRAIAAWERWSGRIVSRWALGAVLPVYPNANPQTLPGSVVPPIHALDRLNAFYDRATLRFFIHPVPGLAIPVRTGASVDIVSHEVGHAILDAIRPELWDVNAFEVRAMHEAFGDCVSLLTALANPDQADEFRAANGAPNRLEAMGESLADGLARALPGLSAADRARVLNATAPRRASNAFRYRLPETADFADTGPPGQLVDEPHSFSQVFTGSIHDFIRAIGAGGSAIQLTAALEVTGVLLDAAIRSAPLTTQFFRSVGSQMLVEDQSRFGGAHAVQLRAAFAAHGIAIGTGFFGPSSLLPGGGALGAVGAVPMLGRRARAEVAYRLRVPKGGVVSLDAIGFGSTRAVRCRHRRRFDGGRFSRRLRGVSVETLETAYVGSDAGRPAVFGPTTDAGVAEAELAAFVASLVRRDSIDYEPRRAASLGATRVVARRWRAVARAATPRAGRRRFEPSREVSWIAPPMLGAARHSHGIVARGSRFFLARRRFTC